MLRRVGFRSGTDEELAAQHLVESEIDAERHPGRAPQPREAYASFARSLPTLFEDHAWVAEDHGGTTLGCCACWSNTAGDTSVMECSVHVRPAWRRRGTGTMLARAVAEEAVAGQRSTLVWSTYDSAPAGEDFSRRLGATVARVNRNSDLALADVDSKMVRDWIADGPRRAVGYRAELSKGPLPDELVADAAILHNLMNTAPKDDLVVADEVISAAQAAEIDRHLVASGRERWTVFMRTPDGACVGGTEVTFNSWEPAVAYQQNTAIDPGHRGKGLGKWAKALMLAHLESDRPGVSRVTTGNAFSNAAMLAINTALGFEVVEVRTEWQADAQRLRETLRRPRPIG